MKSRKSCVWILLLCLLVPAGVVFAASGPENWHSRISSEGSGLYSESDSEAELIVGREVAAHLLGKFRLTQDAKLQRYVNLVGQTLTLNCSRPDLEFHFAVVDSAEINGYSTPGGYIFVTSAALAAMKNEAELAGVLAHEIGHVAERHIVKEINLRGVEKSAATSLATLIGGSSESAAIAFTHSVDLAVEMILRDGYRKQDEMQADSQAVLLCAFAGYDPTGLVTFLERVSTVKTAVGKSYPLYDERLATLTRVMQENGGVAEAKLQLREERFAGMMAKKEGGFFGIPGLHKLPPPK